MLLRIRLTTALAVAAGCFSACGDESSYTLRWRFADEAPAAFSARNCGLRGVESFVGTETASDGTRRTFRAICGAGELRRTVGSGTWTVSLLPVDAAGRVPAEADQARFTGTAGPFEVGSGEAEPIVEVVVPVRPACSDGIDNNGDGLVDADDRGCQAGADREG